MLLYETSILIPSFVHRLYVDYGQVVLVVLCDKFKKNNYSSI